MLGHLDPEFLSLVAETAQRLRTLFGTSNRLVYMLGYPSLGERETSWRAFGADPAWQRVRAESEKNGTLVAKIRNRVLRPTAYSPRG